MLKSEDEMASQRQPDPPAIDLDDRLDQIGDMLQRIHIGLNEHSEAFKVFVCLWGFWGLCRHIGVFGAKPSYLKTHKIA